LAADNSLLLTGKRVVVTRAPEQARELIAALESRGARVLVLPALDFAPPLDWGPLDRALRELGTFDWAVLTSANAVRFFCERAREVGVVISAAAGPAFAAVGPATARAAEEAGLKVTHLAGRFRGEELARELSGKLAGKRVLLPRSDRARGDLPRALEAAGAVVVEVLAYRTLRPSGRDTAVLDAVRRGEVDAVAFASPSAFHHLVDEVGAERLAQLAENVALAAIGPVTAAAIREAGLPVVVEAEQSTSAGLVEALAAYFARQGAEV
jgi:uroporphyrinogen III methyltransferase/synthase